ncbi:hypothetical protein LCGC14_2749910 [marine sediment metagenome]|uniref:Homing endonuclease LAGLIDADG domain-containing protein n=1 Tax=marine sediment metagenome TaxID=412755 RepID=A0A0F8Z1Z4_9ZZZZ
MCIEAYAAGIMDGDGSIQIQEINRGSSYRFIVYLSGCERSPIDLLHSHWGGGITETVTQTGRPYFRWHITSSKATQFLKDILPYLVGKANQAHLALRFQDAERNLGRDWTMRESMRALATRSRR